MSAVSDDAVERALTFARRNLSYKRVALDNGRLVKVAALDEDFIRGLLAATLLASQKAEIAELQNAEEQLAIRAGAWKQQATILGERVAALEGALDEIERLKRCISMAMGCINPDASDRDLRLAWFRLADALDGKEPRALLRPAETGEPT